MLMPNISCFRLLLAALVSIVANATNPEDSADYRGVSFLVSKVKGLATPSTATVVPEESDRKLDYYHAFSNSAPAQFLQDVTNSGGSEADCREFADETVSGINTSVGIQQDTLNGMDSGENCAQEGQSFVPSSQGELDTAKEVVTDKEGAAAIALAAKTAACTADVAFIVSLDNLKSNEECYDYRAQEKFISAESTCVSATADSATADEAVSIAQTAETAAEAALEKVVAEAAKLESDCYCTVKNAQAAAWALATSSAPSNTADWKQAHKVLCALNKATTCDVPDCPAATKPTLASAVNNADCSPDASTDAITEPTVVDEKADADEAKADTEEKADADEAKADTEEKADADEAKAEEPEATGPCASCTHLISSGQQAVANISGQHLISKDGEKCEPGKKGWQKEFCFKKEPPRRDGKRTECRKLNTEGQGISCMEISSTYYRTLKGW